MQRFARYGMRSQLLHVVPATHAAHQIRDDGKRRSGEHGVGRNGLALGAHASHPSVVHDQLAHGLVRPHLAARSANCVRELFRERGEPSAIVRETLAAAFAAASAAQLELVPEPHRGHVARIRSELPLEQRLPHDAKHLAPAELDEPLLGREPLERAPIRDTPRAKREQPESDARPRRERSESQHVERRAQSEHAIGEIHPRARRAIHDAILDTELAREIGDMRVAREPVMIESFESFAVHREAAGQPANGVVRLEDDRRDASPRELPRGSEPAEAAADDRDAWRHGVARSRPSMSDSRAAPSASRLAARRAGSPAIPSPLHDRIPVDR